MENRSTECVLCGARDFGQLPWYYNYQDIKIFVIRCKRCGLGTLNYCISSAERRQFYSAQYFEDGEWSSPSIRGSYRERAFRIKSAFQSTIRYLKVFKNSGRFLEIGCAGGAALACAKENGYEVTGVEINKTIANWGKYFFNVNILIGTVEEQNFPKHFFDVIYTGDLIEHLMNPVQFLLQIHRIMKKDGILAVSYPTEFNTFIHCVRGMLKIKKKLSSLPYHVFYFTPHVMMDMLSKTGFKPLLMRNEKSISFAIRKYMNSLTVPIEFVNYFVTRLTGLYGNRGFVIASRCDLS